MKRRKLVLGVALAAWAMLAFAAAAWAAERRCVSTGEDLSCYGTSRADTMYGSKDLNLMNGLESSDLMYGAAGSDDLDGDEGDDRLFGGASSDRVYGGRDDDLVAGGQGDDDVFGDYSKYVTLEGTTRNELRGGKNKDRLFADAPGTRDTVYGGPGDDTFYARDRQRDVISCGAGYDIVDVYDRRGLDEIASDCERVRREAGPYPF